MELPPVAFSIHESPPKQEDTGGAPIRYYRAGDLTIDIVRKHAMLRGEHIHLQELSLRMLCLLLDRDGSVVGRRELHQKWWGHLDWDSFERSLNTNMKKLRRAIGDDAREPRLIETVRASGYKWIGAKPTRHFSLPSDASAPATVRATSAVQLLRPTTIGRLALSVLAVACLLSILLVRPAGDSTVHVRLPVDLGESGALENRLKVALQHLSFQGPIDIATIDVSESNEAEISFQNGEHVQVPVSNNPDALDEILVQLMSRQRPDQGHGGTILPADLSHAYVESTSTLSTQTLTLALLNHCIEQLEDITTRAPAHIGAWVSLSNARGILASAGIEPERNRALARSELHAALKQDPQSIEAIRALGRHLLWSQSEFDSANRWLDLARHADPNNIDTLHDLAWLELVQGQSADALSLMSAIAARDPQNSTLQADWGWFFFRTGDYENAFRQCSAAGHLGGGGSWSASECGFRALHMLGRHAEAWAKLSSAQAPWLTEASLKTLNALPPADAFEQSAKLAAAWYRARKGQRYSAAVYAAIANVWENVLDDLAMAVEGREATVPLINVTPEFEPIRSRAEFSSIVLRIQAKPAAALGKL